MADDDMAFYAHNSTININTTNTYCGIHDAALHTHTNTNTVPAGVAHSVSKDTNASAAAAAAAATTTSSSLLALSTSAGISQLQCNTNNIPNYSSTSGATHANFTPAAVPAVAAPLNTSELSSACAAPPGTLSMAVHASVMNFVNFSIGYNSACHEVFGIPEFLEQILLAVDENTVLLAERVSKSFRETVQGSPAIQRKLWLLPPLDWDDEESEDFLKFNPFFSPSAVVRSFKQFALRLSIPSESDAFALDTNIANPKLYNMKTGS